MKKSLFSIALVWVTLFCFGQHFTAELSQLIEIGLLHPRQAEALRTFSKMESVELAPAVILEYLADEERKKLFGEGFGLHYLMLERGDYFSQADKESLSQQMQIRLGQLQEAALVSPQTYAHLEQQISKLEVFHPVQLYTQATLLSRYEQYMEPARVSPFLDSLYQYGVLTIKNKDRLLRDLSTGQLNRHETFLSYCEHARVFDMANYGDAPESYLLPLHQAVAQLVPGLSFRDFAFQIKRDSSSASLSDSQTLEVSLSIKGQRYTQKSFYLSDRGAWKDFGKIAAADFYQLFNRALADQGSPYRIHHVSMHPSIYDSHTHETRFGLIALQADQLPMFRRAFISEAFPYIDPSYEDFSPALSPDRVISAIGQFESLGLFDHLDSTVFQQTRMQVLSSKPDSYSEVLSQFPNVVYVCNWTQTESENPYPVFLQELEMISKGDFSPRLIHDNFQTAHDARIQVGFHLGTQAYECTLDSRTNWFDFRFMNLVEEAVAAQHLSGKFYFLPESAGDLAIIFLNHEQYTHLQDSQLLALEE